MRLLASPVVLALIVGLAACGGDESSPTAPDEDEGPTTGAISVSTSTSGATPDPDGYAVAPDGETPVDVGTDTTVVFSDLSEGDYSIQITRVATNCQQDGSASASVSAGDTVSATVNVQCAESVRDRLVFASKRDGSEYDLYTMLHDGTDVTRLTTGADLIPMAVNAAGTRVLAVGPVSGTLSDYELQIVQPDGSVRQITDDTVAQVISSFSSGGDEVLYEVRDTTHDSYSIYRRAADGSGSRTAVIADSSDTRSPDLSPDGSSIAFVRNDTVSGTWDLYTADADGGNVTPLVQDSTVSPFFTSYSPGGDRLAYHEPGDSAIVVRDLGSGSSQTVTSRSGLVEPRPQWLPGGERLIYNAQDTDEDLYRVDADGTDEIPLTSDPSDDAFGTVARWTSGNE